MIFRLSHKLNAKIKAGTLPTLPLEGKPFADWSAHLFVADRTPYVLLCNTRSLDSTAFCGGGITDVDGFFKLALATLRVFLGADGLEDVYRRHILPATGPIRFSRALGRSVTGCMNEPIVQATFLLTEGESPPFDVGFRLNDVLLSAPGEGGPGSYGTPRGAFRSMAGGVAD